MPPGLFVSPSRGIPCSIVARASRRDLWNFHRSVPSRIEPGGPAGVMIVASTLQVGGSELRAREVGATKICAAEISVSPARSASGRTSPASPIATMSSVSVLPRPPTANPANRSRAARTPDEPERFSGRSADLLLRFQHGAFPLQVVLVDLRQRRTFQRRLEGAQALVDGLQLDDCRP